MVMQTALPHDSTHSIQVLKATEADRSALVRLLANAFDREPFADWFVRRDVRRAARLLRFFDVYWRLAMPHGEVYTSDNRRGVALWIPPGKWKASLWDELLYLPDMTRSMCPPNCHHMTCFVYS